MKPSSGESAPLASMSRSDSSRDVSWSCSSFSIPSGRPPVRSTSLPPCGSIRCVLSATLIGQPRERFVGLSDEDQHELSSHTGRGAYSRRHLGRDEPELLELRDDEGRALLRLVLFGV